MRGCTKSSELVSTLTLLVAVQRLDAADDLVQRCAVDAALVSDLDVGLYGQQKVGLLGLHDQIGG